MTKQEISVLLEERRNVAFLRFVRNLPALGKQDAEIQKLAREFFDAGWVYATHFIIRHGLAGLTE